MQKTIVKNNQSATKEFYIRDAQGNTLAVYEFFDNKLVWKEQHLYGAERIGTYMVEATLYNANTSTTTVGVAIDDKHLFEDNEKTKDGKWVALAHYVGLKRYEITNHLGNVLTVVTDRRLPGKHSIPGQVPTYWQAEVVQLQEYYVFGAKVSNRCWDAGEGYRYGFNGKENDDEVGGGVYAFEARMYSATLGRFFSRDPREAEYAWQSTYAYYRNCPTAVLDWLGMGGDDPEDKVDGTDDEMSCPNDGYNPNSLNYDDLDKNPNFEGLSTPTLRDASRAYRYSLTDWQVKISGGLLLEECYYQFYKTGLDRNHRGLAPHPSNPKPRIVKPDFLHPTTATWYQFGTRAGFGVAVFPTGGVIEVKAPEFPIQLGTSNFQIQGEIYGAANQKSISCQKHLYWPFNCFTSQHDAGVFNLVLPYSATYNKETLPKLCDDIDVNFYVQYAFIHKVTRKVVFCNPILIHGDSDHTSHNLGGDKTTADGIDLPYHLLHRWDEWNKKNTNPTNNSADE